jgi:hypothetical protein
MPGTVTEIHTLRVILVAALAACLTAASAAFSHDSVLDPTSSITL